MDKRDEAAVRARAYQLWVESGYADGYQDQHWRQAEREVAERDAAERASAPGGGATDGGADVGEQSRGRVPTGRHSDGMSAHPSVLDPAPTRSRD